MNRNANQSNRRQEGIPDAALIFGYGSFKILRFLGYAGME